MDLRRSYASAVEGATANTPRNHRTLSHTKVVAGVTAAVAVGVSVLVGGSLFYAAAQRKPHGSEGKAAPAAAASTAASKPAQGGESTPSWWRRTLTLLGFLIHRRPVEDDDDAFASGTGAASLFDEEKTKARQLTKGKSKAASRVGAAATVTTASGVTAPSRKPGKTVSSARTKPDAATAIGFPSDIAEREQHIKLVRVLLRRQAGIDYSDDESSTDSDTTDVSLNYHLASAMEAKARDDLLMAFAAYEDYNDGVVFGSATRDKTTAEEGEKMQVDILVKTLEYLDMSNEREKLRCRRIAMYREQDRSTPGSSIGTAEAEEVDDDDDDSINAMYRQLAAQYGSMPLHEELDDESDDAGEGDGVWRDELPSAASRRARQFQAIFGPSMLGMGTQTEGNNAGDSVLDRILGQASSASAASGGGNVGIHAHPIRPIPTTAANKHHDGDMMEEQWEDEDDDEETDFMAYLQQPDDAAHFYSRNEMRQALRDPSNDVRVEGPHNAIFDLHDDDAEDAWEDDAEEDEEPAEPWSRQDKAEFERELFARIHQLASTYTLTAAMAEREVEEEEARKLVERQQQREQKKQQKPQVSTTKAPSGKAVQSLAPVVEEDDEWEDEGDWEDDNEDL
jgi:hypothetical protein